MAPSELPQDDLFVYLSALRADARARLGRLDGAREDLRRGYADARANRWGARVIGLSVWLRLHPDQPRPAALCGEQRPYRPAPSWPHGAGIHPDEQTSRARFLRDRIADVQRQCGADPSTHPNREGRP